ncbi:MAG TPA: BTAD domain-containing putative transcriptional regulator [Acidimicrobiales bacterium]
MYFSILGSFAAWRGGEALQLGGAKRRALLAFLVVHANEFVAADTLIEHLWRDSRPDAATATLQSHISQLRKVLGPGCLHTEVGAYRLSLGAGELDASLFEAELAEGQQHLRAGDAAGAVELLEAALSRWHGTPLGSVDGELWASGLISRLVQLRATAIEALLSAKLELGHHHHVIGLAEAAIAEHPVQEALWGQLMLSLYRSGRQAEALQTYQRLRETLVDELGLEPTPQLARLEQSILQHDPELEWTGPPADNGLVGAAAGTGGAAPAAAVAATPGGLAFNGRLPLPPRVAALSTDGFVGRVDERRRLGELLRQVSEGSRRVALLAGEPGIGKTRLAALVAREAEPVGTNVLYGSCSEDLGAPYEPFLEALGHAATHLPTDVLAAQVEAHGDVLTRLVPEMARRFPVGPASAIRDPESERYLLFQAAAGLLGALASAFPVVLILDDLHWAEKSTLLLLRFLLSVEPAPRVLIVGTYRHSDLSRHHPLTDVLAALRRDPSVERLALGGLGDTEVLELVERTFDGRLDDSSTSLVQALGRETDGNPFFAGELLRHLAESGGLHRADDGRLIFEGSIASQGFPDSVREVIARRIDRLGDSATRALTAASVIGRNFDLGLLASVLDADEDDLLELLEQATSANLLTSNRTDQFSFIHALAAHALYEELSLSRRSRLHQRVAEFLQDRSAADGVSRSAELAYHWSRTNEVATAIVHARQAGREALAQLGPDQAARWFELALELLHSKDQIDDRLRSDLLTDLGEAQRQAGDPAYRQTLLDAAHLAQSLGATPVLVRSALANHRGDTASTGQVDAERVAVLEDALVAVDQADTPAHARLLATLASELQWAPDWQRRLAVSDAGLAMARRLADPATLATVLSARHEAIRIPPTLVERLDNTEELLSLSEALGDPRQRGFAALWRAHSSWENADVAEVDRSMGIVAQEVPRAGDPYLLWNLAAHRSTRALIDGRLEDAEKLAHEAYRIAVDSGQPDAIDILAAQLHPIKSNQGRLHEIEALLADAAAGSPGSSTWSTIYSLAQNWVPADDTSGEIRRRLEEEAATGFSDVAYNKNWLFELAARAPVYARLGLLKPAAVLYDLMVPWSAQVIFCGSAVTGSVARPVAVLAALLRRWRQADDLFAEAAACHERMQAPVFLARTQVDWARMLLDRGPSHGRRAEALLTEALGISQEIGLGPVERRARQQLARLPA